MQGVIYVYVYVGKTLISYIVLSLRHITWPYLLAGNS